MDKYRLLRKLLMGLTAVALAYFVMERWPSKPDEHSVASFCITVAVGLPVQQLLVEAAGRELSTTLSENSLRIYNTRTDDTDACQVGHTGGVVTSRELLSQR